MRHIHSEKYSESHHFLELRNVITEFRTNFQGALSFCPHCESLQEQQEDGKCLTCHRQTKEMPTELRDQEAYLMAEFRNVLVFDFRWLQNGKQIQFIVLNGRDV